MDRMKRMNDLLQIKTLSTYIRCLNIVLKQATIEKKYMNESFDRMTSVTVIVVRK